MVPLYNSYHQPGLLTLTAHGDGTASGRLSWPLSFMGTRADRVPRVAPASIVSDPDTISETDLHPRLWVAHRDAAMAIGQRLGDGVRHQWQQKGEPGRGTMWVLDPASRSWASVRAGDEPPYRVRQGGLRRLFDEIADAYRWWQQAGEPAVTDWTVTVGPDGQALTLPERERALT